MRAALICLVSISVCGCAEQDASTKTDMRAHGSISPVVQEATNPIGSSFINTPTSELVEYCLHFHEEDHENQNYDTFEATEDELVRRGADTIQELLKHRYALTQYPYNIVSMDLIEAIGTDARSAIPVLAELLSTGKDPTGQYRVVDCLIAIGPEAIPELVKHYHSEDDRSAWAVSMPLRRLGAGVVPHIQDTLKSQAEERRRITLDVLSDIGPDAAETIPAVRQLLQDDTYRNQLAAARTLVNLGDTDIGLTFLFAEVDRWNSRQSRDGDSPPESFWAIVELGNCRVTDKTPIVNKLLHTLEHPDLKRRLMALGALKPHGRDTRVQQALREILLRDDRRDDHPKIAGLFGSWGDQFRLDHEDQVIELLEQSAAGAEPHFAYGIRSDLGRIQTRRWLESIQEMLSKAE